MVKDLIQVCLRKHDWAIDFEWRFVCDGENLHTLDVNLRSSGCPLLGDDVNGVVADGVFTALIDLRDALIAEDEHAITNAAKRLETAREKVVSVNGEIGARSQAMQTRLRFTEDAVLATRTLLSDVKDLDYIEAITRFQQAQTTLQANLLTGSRMLEVSLLNFLR